MRIFLVIILLLFSIRPIVTAAAMQPKTVDKVRNCCVEVLVDRQLRGGGAIIESKNGKSYVITAAHLFPRPNPHITIMTEGHGIYNANLLAFDFGHDLALLEIVTSRQLPSLPIASYIPSPTQPVYNFGPALKRRTLIISGSIAESRLNYTDFDPSKGYLRHIFIAAINPVFTSGGIWVNQQGEAVGVQSGRLKGDAGAPSSGLSMACPPGAIQRLLNNKVSANTPGIGGWVWELWTIDHKVLDRLPERLQGLAVRLVREGGSMHRAGIKVNEIITECDGEKIYRRNEFFAAIRAKRPGSRFTLKVFSPLTQKTRKVKLETEHLEAAWNLYLQKLKNR